MTVTVKRRLGGFALRSHNAVVERPGVEPGLLVLQTSVQTALHHLSLGAVMGVEPIARAYETQCVTGRTPQCLGLNPGRR
jgi:hypothetical protein